MGKATAVTSTPMMQWASSRANRDEFTPAGVRTLKTFSQKWLLEASYTSESYSSLTKLPLPAPFLSFLLPPISVTFHQGL